MMHKITDTQKTHKKPDKILQCKQFIVSSKYITKISYHSHSTAGKDVLKLDVYLAVTVGFDQTHYLNLTLHTNHKCPTKVPRQCLCYFPY